MGDGAREITVLQLPKFKAEGPIIYLYVVIAARIYLLHCYAKNVRTDLTTDEKRELRQIAAHLKGAQ
jgi:phage-related protein